jgi:hypothetical protein
LYATRDRRLSRSSGRFGRCGGMAKPHLLKVVRERE